MLCISYIVGQTKHIDGKHNNALMVLLVVSGLQIRSIHVFSPWLIADYCGFCFNEMQLLYHDLRGIDKQQVGLTWYVVA